MTQIMIPAWVEGTLQPVEKLAAHERGLKHKAVSVFVISGEHILIQQRAMCKYHTPGLWANTCCTHPEWDEAPNICADRRVQEELGITGLHMQYRGEVEYRADVGDGLIEHEVVQVYLTHASREMAFEVNPEEVMATRWIAHDTLLQELHDTPSKFTPWLRIYMAQHADLIFGEAVSA
jgi:isopentenyl-diphosphate delta-isomerase